MAVLVFCFLLRKEINLRFYIYLISLFILTILLVKIAYGLDVEFIYADLAKAVTRSSPISLNDTISNKFQTILLLLKRFLNYESTANYLFYCAILLIIRNILNKKFSFSSYGNLLFFTIIGFSNLFYLLAYDFEAFRFLNSTSIFQGFIFISIINESRSSFKIAKQKLLEKIWKNTQTIKIYL